VPRQNNFEYFGLCKKLIKAENYIVNVFKYLYIYIFILIFIRNPTIQLLYHVYLSQSIVMQIKRMNEILALFVYI